MASLSLGLLLPLMLWGVYLRRKDRLRPEPWLLMLMTLLAGAGAGFLTARVYLLLPEIGLPSGPWLLSGGELHLYCVGVTGVIEETAKALFLVGFVIWRPAFSDEDDGIFYAAVSALGFATYENYYHWRNVAESELLWRALASPFAHIAFSCVWGEALAEWRIRRRRSPFWVALAFFYSFLLHGVYNYAILSGSKFRYFSAVLILVTWVWILLQWDRQRKRQREKETSIRQRPR